MSNGLMKKLLVLVLFISLTIVLVTLAIVLYSRLDSSKEIGDGYTLVRVYSNGNTIVDADNTVIVLENVSSYDTNNEFIFGFREQVTNLPFIDQPYGYFIINKVTKEKKMGVPETEFLEFLKQEHLDFDSVE